MSQVFTILETLSLPEVGLWKPSRMRFWQLLLKHQGLVPGKVLKSSVFSLTRSPRPFLPLLPITPKSSAFLLFFSFPISMSCISCLIALPVKSVGSPEPPRGLSSKQESVLKQLLFYILEPGQMHDTHPCSAVLTYL